MANPWAKKLNDPDEFLYDPLYQGRVEPERRMRHAGAFEEWAPPFVVNEPGEIQGTYSRCAACSPSRPINHRCADCQVTKVEDELTRRRLSDQFGPAGPWLEGESLEAHERLVREELARLNTPVPPWWRRRFRRKTT